MVHKSLGAAIIGNVGKDGFDSRMISDHVSVLLWLMFSCADSSILRLFLPLSAI